MASKHLRTFLEELGCERCVDPDPSLNIRYYGTNDEMVWLYLQKRAGRSCVYVLDYRVLPKLTDKGFLLYNTIWDRLKCDEHRIWVKLSLLRYGRQIEGVFLPVVYGCYDHNSKQ